MTDLIKKALPWLIVIALLAAILYAYRWYQANDYKPMQSVDAEVPKHDVQPKPDKPIKALDKKALREKGVISKKQEQAENKELLATGTVETDSGVFHVGAELDTDTGETQLIQHRPIAELMSRNALGGAFEWDPRDGIVKEVYYSRTFGRALNGYVSASIGARQYERAYEEKNTTLFIRLSAEWRW